MIHFSKMHGLGNDCIIVNDVKKNINFTPKIIRYLSNRKYGIGFDQLLVIETSNDPKIDFKCRIFNSNGQEVENCGNGIRCIALFIYKKKLIKKRNIIISIKNKHIFLFIKNNNIIHVNMGEPILKKKIVSFKKIKKTALKFLLSEKENIIYDIIYIGNPHFILFTESINTNYINYIGSFFSNDKQFPEGINVNFVKILSKKHIFLRVYERDVGETNACGSGACAAVVSGIIRKKLDKKVKVDLIGGSLLIKWNGPGRSIYMEGPATHVYDGCISF